MGGADIDVWKGSAGAEAPEGRGRAPVHGRATSMEYAEEYSTVSYKSRAKAMKDERFTAVKFDLDVPTPYTAECSQESGSLANKEVGHLTELVEAAREGAGDGTDVVFDLHWKYDVSSSISLARRIEGLGVMWLEDPVPPENPGLLREVASATTVPIASGENHYGRYQLGELLGCGLRVTTPDAPKAGGLLECLLVAQMAAMKEVTVSPHNISSPVGTMAQAHLAAAIPNAGVLEFHGHGVPLWPRLTKGGSGMIKRGYIEMTDKPGLGVELDEKVAARYALWKFEL